MDAHQQRCRIGGLSIAAAAIGTAAVSMVFRPPVYGLTWVFPVLLGFFSFAKVRHGKRLAVAAGAIALVLVWIQMDLAMRLDLPQKAMGASQPEKAAIAASLWTIALLWLILTIRLAPPESVLARSPFVLRRARFASQMAYLLAIGHILSAVSAGIARTDLLFYESDFLLIVGCEGVFTAALLWTAGLLREGRCAADAGIVLLMASALGGLATVVGMPMVYVGDPLPVRILMVLFLMVHAFALLAGYRTALAGMVSTLVPQVGEKAMAKKKGSDPIS
jgi:hypothetical protein